MGEHQIRKHVSVQLQLSALEQSSTACHLPLHIAAVKRSVDGNCSSNHGEEGEMELMMVQCAANPVLVELSKLLS